MPVTLRSPDSVCPRCSAAFACGARDGEACWCAALPALPAAALDPGAGCLCPECLQAELHAAARRPTA